MNLPGKIVLGYLGLGAIVAIVRQISGVTPPAAGLAAGVAMDVLAWPYTVYQWASASMKTQKPVGGFVLRVG